MPKKTQQLTTTTTMIPTYLRKTAGTGTEHLTAEDVKMPRLVLAQAMSDQVNQAHADHIDGLAVGDFFNSVTGDIYGKTITFTPLVSFPPHCIEFAPMEQGGGLIERNVPLTDPRCAFGPNGEAPQATKFYEYILMLSPGGATGEDLIALSLSRSAIKAAKSLNGLIQMRGSAIWSGIYTATSVARKTTQGSYMGWRFQNLGFIAEDLVERYAQLHAGLLTSSPVVDVPF